MVTNHSLTDDTARTFVQDVEDALDRLTVIQSDPRIPSDVRKRIADAAHLLRGALRKQLAIGNQEILAIRKALHKMQDEMLRFLDVFSKVPPAVRERWDVEFFDTLKGRAP